MLKMSIFSGIHLKGSTIGVIIPKGGQPAPHEAVSGESDLGLQSTLFAKALMMENS